MRNARNTAPKPEGRVAVLQWSEKNGTVEKRFLSRKTVRDPREQPHRPDIPRSDRG